MIGIYEFYTEQTHPLQNGDALNDINGGALYTECTDTADALEKLSLMASTTDTFTAHGVRFYSLREFAILDTDTGDTLDATEHPYLDGYKWANAGAFREFWLKGCDIEYNRDGVHFWYNRDKLLDILTEGDE